MKYQNLAFKNSVANDKEIFKIGKKLGLIANQPKPRYGNFTFASSITRVNKDLIESMPFFFNLIYFKIFT